MRITIDDFIKRANKIHNNKYDYSKANFINTKIKILIICPIHGDFLQRPGAHINKNKPLGCSKCHPNAKMSQEDFINKVSKIFNNFYTYEKSLYINMRSKLIITCPIHGDFEQKALSHIQGRGCKLCADDDKRIPVDDFIKMANIIHNNKYNYDINWQKSNLIINIMCPKHGIFSQNKFNHLRGLGCRKCAIENMRYTTEIFIKLARQIHGIEKYSYEKTKYIDGFTNVIIICNTHNKEFEQLPVHHIRGSGCPICAKVSSKAENDWLDIIEIPLNFRNLKIKIGNKFFKPDAIDIENKIIYEFYGDYWHGNPKVFDQNKNSGLSKSKIITFGELFSKTIEREKYLITQGYKIVSIWESDFYENYK